MTKFLELKDNSLICERKFFDIVRSLSVMIIYLGAKHITTNSGT